MIKLISLHIVLFLGVFVLGQEVPPEVKTYIKKYPEARAVSLDEVFDIDINLKKDKINISENQFTETLYLDESASYDSEASISFSSFFEIKNITAKSYIYNGAKYIPKKVTDFTIGDNLSGVFHDDQKTIKFIYPNLAKGGKSSLEFTTYIKNPRFLKTIYLGSTDPIKHKKVTITVDNNIQLKFKYFNADSIDYHYTKTQKGGKTIHSWELKDIPPFEYTKYSSYRKKVPHVIPMITEYKTKSGETKKLLNNVEGLYKWYYSLVKDINRETNDEELIHLVDSLTKDATNDLEKVKNIYYWVQQNVKYIAFEDGLGGFIPREAEDVFSKKYGDCKDNSSLLDVMLNKAGLNGYLTWVGTRKIPYSYTEVPTPLVDNHMILTYIDKDSNFYFLDATGRYQDIELPSSFIQGKECLIGIDSSRFIVKKIPVVDAEKNVFYDSCSLEIEGKSLKGRGRQILKGYPKDFIFSKLETITKEDDKKEFYKNVLEKGNNKFIVSDIEEKNNFDYEAPFIVDYDFTIDDYAQTNKDKLYINLNLDKEITSYKPEKDLEEPLEHKYKSLKEQVFVLEIPKNYTVEYLPKDFILKKDKYQAEINYKIKDNTIIYTQNIVFDFIELSEEEVSDFRDFITKIEKQQRETVVFSKK